MKYINLLIAMGLFCAGNTQAQNTKNSLLFYRLEKNGSYTLISDTAGKYANAADLKISKEENVEIYYRYKGSDYTKATYTGEMTRVKLDAGKVDLPHGVGTLKSERLNYSGEWHIGTMNGTGDLLFDGDNFSGEWENNVFQGTGFAIYKDGSRYDGYWKNSQKQGAGVLKMADGTIWKSKWKSNLPYDSGSVKYPSGAVYSGGVSGKLLDGKEQFFYEGYGRYYVKYISEDTAPLFDSLYAGFYKDGLANGKGKMVINGNAFGGNIKITTYEGSWLNGVKNGTGREEKISTMGQTAVYEGEWKNNQRNGKGVEEMNDMGKKIERGEWKDDKFLTGEVETITPLTDIENYTRKQRVENGVETGPVTEMSEEGTYNGEWWEGSRNGRGKMLYKDGRIFDGEWKDGKPNGQGVMTLADKTVQSGKFIDGEFQIPFTCVSVQIGSQVWMAENLNVSRFRNGEAIPEAKTKEEWELAMKEKQPAWCYYDSDPANEAKYGKLYNWYAVNDSRGLAPEGWHIPSNEEWTLLSDFLGGEMDAGFELKGTTDWSSGGNNGSKFNGLPGGNRSEDGTFNGKMFTVSWWTSSAISNETDAAVRQLIDARDNSMVNGSIMTMELNKGQGCAVRCIKNK